MLKYLLKQKLRAGKYQIKNYGLPFLAMLGCAIFFAVSFLSLCLR